MDYPTPTSIDLHGKRCDEAVDALSYFLDQSNRQRVRVVHGDGSGKLRYAVRKYLGSRGDVVKFEPEAENITGDGVTLVYLK